MTSSSTPHDYTLHGSCACSRNHYTIVLPTAATPTTTTQVFFSNSAANLRAQATPITAWIRIPLSTFHSTTHAFFPDETHASIRRTWHSAHPTDPSTNFSTAHPASDDSDTTPRTRRQFCGYCGTHLTAWREEDAQWLDVTLGSLEVESWSILEGLGVLGSEASTDEEDEGKGERGNEEDILMRDEDGSTAAASMRSEQRNLGFPWFEELVEDSSFGRRVRRRRRRQLTSGGTTVTWEVVEVGEDEEEDEGRREEGKGAKRKRV